MVIVELGSAVSLVCGRPVPSLLVSLGQKAGRDMTLASGTGIG